MRVGLCISWVLVYCCEKILSPPWFQHCGGERPRRSDAYVIWPLIGRSGRSALFRQAVFRQAVFRQALFRQAVFQYGTIPPTRLFNYQFLILVYKQMFTVTSFALLSICWNYFVSTKSIRYFSIRQNQWRWKQFESGGHMACAERERITGVWGRSPQWGPGAEPLVRGSGGEAPLKLKGFRSKGQEIFAPLPNFWKCWHISQTLLRIKVGLRYTNNTHILRVREREQTELSHLQCIWCTKPHCPQSLPSNI